MHGPDRDYYSRVQGIDISRDDGLQGHDQHGGRHDGVGRLVGHGAMAASTLQADGGVVARGHGRAGAKVAHYPGAPLLRHVAAQLPHYRVSLARGHTDTLVGLLRDVALEAVVVDIRYLKSAPDLHVEQQVQSPGAVLCREGHPLLKKLRVDFKDLAPTRWPARL